jgi:hypothetical protein
MPGKLSDYDIAVFLKDVRPGRASGTVLQILRTRILGAGGPFFDAIPFRSSDYDRCIPIVREIKARRRDPLRPETAQLLDTAQNMLVRGLRSINKKHQMRWNRAMVQPFLDVRTAVLNDTLEDAFRRRYPSFCPAIGDEVVALAA